MTVTPESFKIRFPEFTSQTNARIQLFIDDAVLVLSESDWDIKYDLAINYYTAHNLSLAIKSESSGGSGGGGGAVSSRSVDGSSISYATKTADNNYDSYWSSTSYGIKYLSLQSTLPRAMCIV